jgi:hypothetical protein
VDSLGLKIHILNPDWPFERPRAIDHSDRFELSDEDLSFITYDAGKRFWKK